VDRLGPPRSKTPAEALKTAVELMGLGLEKVSIADAKGHQYTCTENLNWNVVVMEAAEEWM
jgi:hypothetical protein